MPQIVHADIIPGGNRYYGGIFGANGLFGQQGLGTQLAQPFLQGASHAIASAAGMQSPADQAAELQLEAAKQSQGQRIYNDYLSGRSSDSEAQHALDELGYNLQEDKAKLMPSLEEEVSMAGKAAAAKAGGYDTVNHRYSDVGEDAPVTRVPNAQAAATPGINPTEEVKSNVGMRMVEEPNALSAAAGASAKAAPDYQPFPAPSDASSNPVKVKPIDAFNLQEMQEKGPDYIQEFLKPDDGQKFNFQGLSRSDQQKAQVVSNRLLGAVNMFKLYDTKQVSAPEDVAKVNSMLRTSEKDINQMVDWHNATTTGDINKIRGMGGALSLAMDLKSLQMLSPAYIASLPPAARGKVEGRARDITARLQQLSPFELKSFILPLSQALGDESTKMVLDYQKGMAQVGAMNNQSNVGIYKANLEDAQNKRTLYEKDIPHMNLEAKHWFLDYQNDKVQNQAKAYELGNEAAKTQLGYAQVAAKLGIAKNQAAVHYAAMDTTLRRQESMNRVALNGQMMTALNDQEKRNLTVMLKTHAGLSSSANTKNQIAAATANQMSADPKIRKAAEDFLTSVVQGGNADGAALIAQKGFAPLDILKSLGIPLPVGINPAESSGLAAKQSVAKMAEDAATMVDKFYKAGIAPPVELLNMRDHTKVDETGSLVLDKDAYQTEEDSTLTEDGLTRPRDQQMVQLIANQAAALKALPSREAWLGLSVGGIKNRDIFKDPKQQDKYFNELVKAYRSINGQR